MRAAEEAPFKKRVLRLQIVSQLKEEIAAMEKEHSDLQEHISCTDWWCENLGVWRAVISGTEVGLYPRTAARGLRRALLHRPNTGADVADQGPVS